MHYFAYANLMNVDIMKRIAPSARVVSNACLKDYRISFASGKDPSQAGASLEKEAGAETWGVQYELSSEDMAALDRAAGVAEGHFEHLAIVVGDGNGKPMPSTTYVVANPRSAYAPPQTYVEPIFRGASSLDLPADYLKALETIVARAQAGA